MDGIATMRIRDLNDSLEAQRAEIIQKYQPEVADLILQTLETGKIQEEDFFCHVTHKTWDSVLHDVRKAHEKDIESAPEESNTKKLIKDIQRAVMLPGDYISRVCQIIYGQLGIDFDKLPEDEQASAKKTLRRSPALKNSPLNNRRKK